MRSISYYVIILFIGATIIGCEGDFRERANGSPRDFTVIMDSTMWESATANAIRDTYGKLIFTLPNPESNYNLNFQTIRSRAQLDRLRQSSNLIFAAPIDEETNVGRQIRAFLDDGIEQRVRDGESFAFPIEDQWYKDQYVMILSSTSDSVLAEKIKNSEEALLSDVLKRELKRWEWDVYDKKEQTHYSDSLWEDHGFSVRFQHDYVKGVDTLNFQTYRRLLPNNERRIFIWWQDDVKDIGFLDDDWINSTRDSLLQEYFKGSRENVYVSTEYRRPVETSTFQKDRLLGYETLGTWRLVNGAMGGPFVNFTYYDPDTERLFMVEYQQFAPKIRQKLRFVRQFRAMGRTFERDSLYYEREVEED